MAITYKLRDGTSLSDLASDTISLGGKCTLKLSKVTAGVQAALRRLLSEGGGEDELCDAACEIDGQQASTWLVRYYVRQLLRMGYLDVEVRGASGVLATVQGASDVEQLIGVPTLPDGQLSLSRFAYLHSGGGQVLVESPLTSVRVAVHNVECFALLHGLMQARGGNQTVTVNLALLQGDRRTFLGLLCSLRLLDEDKDEARYWEFHDMLFHARSRLFLSADPIGATFRFGRQRSPAPACKPHMSSEVVKLHRPDMNGLRRADMPLTQALETRRSLRGKSSQTMSSDQLGEFLYRTCRSRSGTQTVDVGERPSEAGRPYPNAGACYELEVYVVIQLCAGLERGLYHYAADSHELCRMDTDSARVVELVADAGQAAGGVEPHVLFIVGARVQRVFWKYQGIAYSLILKNVGVLFQTMYLVATAMGLRPCAIGGGSARLFAKATGIDGLVESSVGEFILSGCERRMA